VAAMPIRTRVIRESAAILVALTMLTAACTETPERRGSPTVPGSRTVPAPEWPPFEAEGPLAGIVMAADIDASGRAVEPALTFEPGAPQVTAIVGLEEVDVGQTLVIVWNRVLGLEQRERLFEHRIPVESFASAFSVGLSPGELAEGSYEVVATLGEHEVWTPWSVTTGAIPSVATRAKTGPGAMELVAHVAQGAGGEAGPPEPGESGAEPWFDEEPGGDDEEPGGDAGPCTGVRVSGFAGDFTEIRAEAQEVGDCEEVLLGAGMAGGEYVLAARGPDAASRTFEPCQLPAGSDLPGEVVEVVAQVPDPQIGDDIDRVELRDLGLPPFVDVTTDPPSGRVRPGDTIEWMAVAIQLPVGGTAEGIRSLEVRSPEGVLDRTPERHQRACDLERFFAKLEGTYTVPEDPPPLIEITAHAEDFEGRPGANAAYFSKEGQVWQGTLTWDAQGPTDVQHLIGIVGINIAPDDSVVGSMTAIGIALAECCPPVTYTHGCRAGGSREGNALELEFHTCRTDPGEYGTAWAPLTLTIVENKATFSRNFGAGGKVEIELTCVSGC